MGERVFRRLFGLGLDEVCSDAAARDVYRSDPG